MKLTIIIPAHNEQESLPITLNGLIKNVIPPHDIIVIDDYSTDNTSSVVSSFAKKNPNIKLIKNDYEAGFTNAIKMGFSQISEGVIVSVMADNCDDPTSINHMYAKMIQGYDLVCASRYMKGGKRIGRPLQGFFSKSVGLILYFLLGVPTHDASNAFKMYSKKMLDSITIEEAGFASSLEITVKAFIYGFKITEVPTIWRKRELGKSKFKINNVTKNYFYWFFWAIFKRLFGRL